MTGTAFEEFAEAIAAQGPSVSQAPAPDLDHVAILGGGRDARLLAAICLAEDAEVTLFSAYGAELATLRDGSGITIRGDGPVGTYQVDQDGMPSVRTTAELDRAVAGAQLIFLTGPVHKQRTYAMVLADHLRDGQVLALAPGRSFGAAEAAWLLRVGGCRADCTIVEVQALPYWIAESGNALHTSRVGKVPAATLPAGRINVLEGVRSYLGNIEPLQSTVHSGFADGSGLIEVPALMLGGPAVGDGTPVVPSGGVPLEQNRTFRTLIGDRHIPAMAAMADERSRVASKFGIRDLPAIEKWLDIYAGATKGEGARPVPSSDEARAIVRCATLGSLAPLSSAARVCGIKAPVTDAMIALASSVLGADIATAGRRFDTIGIDADGIENVRQILDDIARGSR